jgi:Domain of unknown function (DUF4864)
MSRLLSLLFCIAAAQFACAETPSKPSAEAVKQTLHTVIKGQLEAFRRGDFAAAYEFAAPGIREKFPVAAFTEMVKTSYPEIAANADVVFGLTFDDGDSAVVNVRIVGKDKGSRRYQYSLERAGKDWRITGVVPLPENESI